MIDLAIQFVNFKTKKYLKESLAGLLADLEGLPLSWQISVVDNNSGDDLSDLEKKYKKQQVKVYYSDRNSGFGAGHNFLAGKVAAKYLLILNTDIKFIEKKTVARLVARIEEDQQVKVVGPALITAQGKVQQWDHGESEGLIAALTLNSYWQKHRQLSRVAWVSGACFLMDKQLFHTLGGFDEKFFLYAEETDLCLRVRKSGFVIIYDPTILLFHFGQVVAKVGLFMRKSNSYYLKKNYSEHPFYWLFKLVNRLMLY